MYDNEGNRVNKHGNDTMNLAGIAQVCGRFQLHLFVFVSILVFDS